MKMIFPLTVTMLMFYLCFFPVTFGKTIHGVFSSDAARKGSGQYITKFLFHGGNALMVYRLEDVSTAMKKDARLLLFQDLEKFDNLSCQHRLSRARLSMTLSAEEHNQTIPHTAASPRAWYVLYADRYTCHQDKIAEDLKDLRFQIMLFNPNAEGDPLDHFSAEEAGLHGFYLIFLVAYVATACIYARLLWRALHKGGPMHTALKVLSAALLLQAGSALFSYIHLARYARDGIGAPFMGTLAEFCNMVSQVHMVFMLLSLCMGWTLSSRKTQSKPLQWDTSPTSTALALGSVAIQGALLVWEQFEDTDHHSYHAHGSTAGLLLVALRVVLALLLTSILYRIVRAERSGLKRDYYLSFAKGCLLWFLCHPVLVLLSAAFNEHHRQKVTTIGVILCQSISVVVLYRLFLCRSLYWEVSSPSSVTLPLTMSRDRRCPY
ncbi:integral membrane protein GPR180-like isoform X2 [Scleropages formosus]|uniref:integral membrane protein GPR180-like isoform X2 n=1 Tax=Scleropages formosus TaxID=113540 RepID=UPI0008781054|nr:integral membrane protein GPR180-like isoform X2 [Scleropages formosus]